MKIVIVRVAILATKETSEGVTSLKELTVTYINKASSFYDSSGKVKTCCQNFFFVIFVKGRM